MKFTRIFLLLAALFPMTLFGQYGVSVNTSDRASEVTAPFSVMQAPFYHGVASGDPLDDAVIIWTRVTPPVDQVVSVNWEVADAIDFANIVKSGQLNTDMTKDYTAKVDVTGLASGTTYYYRFTALGETSIMGRTKTLQSTNVDHIKIGVVSCNNYQSGYFTSFRELSKRNDIDVVVHLGDFIYEYETGGYGYYGDTMRSHVPNTEILDISDYRTRYSHYRLDADLQEVMRQHPFVHIWDDHEVANDSWKDGAGNHDPVTEGAYADRKNWATQAFFEWAPLRDNATNTVYRNLKFGNLMDLVMLDTRHHARSIQVDSFNDPDRLDPNRVLLGPDQMSWFKGKLVDNSTTWKIIGNQIVFAPLLLDNVEPVQAGARDLFLDVWNGYPTRRDTIIDHIKDNNIDNVVFLTGDVHISLGFDITQTPDDPATYDPATGTGSVAVEFVTPSISSDNYDEILGPIVTQVLEGLFPAGNPHNKFFNFRKHGYIVLDVTPTKVQGDFYHIDDVRVPGNPENFTTGLYSDVNANFLTVTNTPAPPKAIQEVPAPPLTSTGNEEVPDDVLLLSTYPNPTSDLVTINYALSAAGKIKINLMDINGRLVNNLFEHTLASGNFILRFHMNDLPSGVYFVQFETANGMQVKKVVKQ